MTAVTGGGGSVAAPAPSIAPTPLSKWQSLVLASADDLSPSKLNESLDKRLAFVTTNLALIATVATGFGLFADTGGVLRENRGGLTWTFGLLLAALLIALVGSLPNWRRRVNVSDLNSVESYFMGRYRWRSWAARLSIAVFVIAVAVAGFTVASVVGDSPRPAISLSYAVGEKPTVTAAVTAAAIEAGEEVATRLEACTGGDGEDCTGATLLAADVTRADATGKAEVKLSAPVPANTARAKLTTTVGGKTEIRVLDLS